MLEWKWMMFFAALAIAGIVLIVYYATKPDDSPTSAGTAPDHGTDDGGDGGDGGGGDDPDEGEVTILLDTFTSGSNVLISAHTPEIGPAWTAGSYGEQLTVTTSNVAEQTSNVTQSGGVSAGSYGEKKQITLTSNMTITTPGDRAGRYILQDGSGTGYIIIIPRVAAGANQLFIHVEETLNDSVEETYNWPGFGQPTATELEIKFVVTANRFDLTINGEEFGQDTTLAAVNVDYFAIDAQQGDASSVQFQDVELKTL